MWKSQKRVETNPFVNSDFVNLTALSVTCCVKLIFSYQFTDLEKQTIVENALKSTKTVTQLVDNPVQIFIRLAMAPDFIDRVQNGSVVFPPKLSSNLRQ